MLHFVFVAMVFFARALLAAMLIVAGVDKLVDRAGFTATLVALWGSPRTKPVLIHAATFFPGVELGLGFLIIADLWPIIIDVAVVVLMVIFSGVIVFALYKAPSTSCRSFGPLSTSRFSQNLLLLSTASTALALCSPTPHL